MNNKYGYSRNEKGVADANRDNIVLPFKYKQQYWCIHDFYRKEIEMKTNDNINVVIGNKFWIWMNNMRVCC